MTLPAPFRNPEILGHDAALLQFEESFRSGRLHHAWLITGPEGIGKATLAAHFAHAALSEGLSGPRGLDMGNPASRLIAAEAHPDLFVLRRAADEKTGALKESIAVEDARKIAPFMRLTPTQGSWRVAVIDEAHCLNRFGQNAILKLIEEPPAGALILITATTPGGLLPTIRSRCRALPLAPLAPDVMETLIARAGLAFASPAEKRRTLAFARGSFGLALKIAATGVLGLWDETEALFADAAFSIPGLYALADRFSKKADAGELFPVFTLLLRESLRVSLSCAASGEGTEVSSLYNGLPLDRLMDLWEKENEIFSRATAANLDRKLALIEAMQEIRSAREGR
jgi:DNA polymerase-3 subunit delta'